MADVLDDAHDAHLDGNGVEPDPDLLLEGAAVGPAPPPKRLVDHHGALVVLPADTFLRGAARPWSSGSRGSRFESPPPEACPPPSPLRSCGNSRTISALRAEAAIPFPRRPLQEAPGCAFRNARGTRKSPSEADSSCSEDSPRTTGGPGRRSRGESRRSSTKLRSKRPAPTRSTRESAISTTTRSSVSRLDPELGVLRWETSLARFGDADRKAGRSPTRSVAPRVVARAIARMVVSVFASDTRGRFPESNERRSWTPNDPIKTPRTPPTRLSSRLSTRRSRRTCRGPPPRAARREISLCRCWARTSRRPETSAQAMRSTAATAPRSARSAGSTSPHHLAVERLDVDMKARALVIGILLPQRLRDRVHLRLRLLESDRGLQSPEDAKSRLVELLGLPASGVSHGIRGLPEIDVHADPDVGRMPEAEPAGKDADDGIGALVELDDPAENRRVGAELALPDAVAQKDRARRLVGREVASEDRRYLHHREEVLGDPSNLHLGGLGAAAEVLPEGADGRDPLEELCPPLVLAEVVPRVAQAEDLPRGPLRPHHHQAVRLGVGKGRKQHRLDDAHQGDGRADAERENENHGEGERGRPGERAQRESNVVQHESGIAGARF